MQNYALKTVISSLGFDVVNLRNFAGHNHRPVIAVLKSAVKHVLAALGVKKYRKQFKLRDWMKLREQKFRSFYERYNSKELCLSVDDVLKPGNKELWDRYIYVVVGSDMVWGHFGFNCTAKFLQYYYLTFVGREKRVCYAPSFGRSEFTFEFPELRKEYTAGFDRISCREKHGCETIKRVTGFDAVHVLDPTMLLKAEDYRVLERKPSYEVPEHYALVYILSMEVSYARKCEYRQVVKHASRGLPMINIPLVGALGVDTEGFSADMFTSTGPEEFLWLVNHADIVLTNSFHGTVFSILFKKSFISLHRPDSSDIDKVEDILLSLGLSSRMYRNDGIIPSPEIDYSSVYEKLEPLRKSSMQYLKDCLHVN